jgi:hypothetical protein
LVPSGVIATAIFGKFGLPMIGFNVGFLGT